MGIIKHLIGAIAISSIVMTSGCKDDDPKCKDSTNPDCENYDPCNAHKPANSDFGIFELVGNRSGNHVLSETDTILNYNGVVLKPVNKNQDFTWIVGAETIHEEEVFRMGFPEGWIEITLIASVNPHECLIEKELHDTLTKKFFVLPYEGWDSTMLRTNPWWGTWEGYNTDAPGESISISWGWIDEFGKAYLSFTGLPPGIPKQRAFYSHSNSVCSGIRVLPGYRIFLIEDDDIHLDYGGFVLNAVCKRDGNKVEIEYSYNDTPYQDWLKGDPISAEPVKWVTKTFKGSKISNTVYTQ